MILAIPLKENHGNMELSLQFARCLFFGIVNTGNNNFRIVNNPFFKDKNGVGKNVLEMLIHNYDTDTIVGFELGLKVQQMTMKHHLNVIILNEKYLTLKDIFKKMTINPNKL